MTSIEIIKERALKHADEKYNELKSQFIEMGQLKSNFDIEKFTIKKEGNFIAHNFHFLMRQYSLAMSELRRMMIEKEEKQRNIEHWKAQGTERTAEGKYPDLEIKRLVNEIDLLDITMTNKACMCDYMEECRKRIIEINGGEITNEQYQAEVPHYWEWFTKKQMLHQLMERKTGISEGTYELIDHLEEKPLINTEFQRRIQNITLNNLIEEIQKEKNKDVRSIVNELHE